MFVHLPAFFIGFMLAPMAKEEKCISFLWMIVVPLFLVIMMKYLHFGYWPGFLVFSFVPLLCRLFCYSGGCYLHYALVIIVGTALAYCVNRFCEKALKKN